MNTTVVTVKHNGALLGLFQSRSLAEQSIRYSCSNMLGATFGYDPHGMVVNGKDKYEIREEPVHNIVVHL